MRNAVSDTGLTSGSFGSPDFLRFAKNPGFGVGGHRRIKVDFVRTREYNVIWCNTSKSHIKSKYYSEADMDYLSIRETSEKWGIGARRITVLCSAGRIPGAERIGKIWVIPKDAEKPKDARIKSGRYIKNKSEEIK